MKIFIASSFEALAYASSLKSLLEEDTKWDITVWKDAEFELSYTIIEALEKIKELYDYAVFIFHPDDELSHKTKVFKSVRDNVIFEYGLFAGAIGIKKCFGVVPTNIDIKEPSDLEGLLFTTYTYKTGDENKESTLRSSAEKIKKAIRNDRRNIVRNERLIRGDFSDSIVDASINVDIIDNELFHQWEESISRGERVKEELLYWDRKTAERWLEYENFTYPSFKLIREIGAGIRREVPTPFDLISLGLGSGKKDIAFLKSATQKGNSYWYYPIDISAYLLFEALRNVTKEFDDVTLKVKGIRANFYSLEKLRYVYRYTNHPNIFSLLGNTLGNYEEADLLTRIANSMVKDDIFLLEVNNVAGLQETLKYENKNYQAFVLEPLRSLGIVPKITNLKFEEADSYPSSFQRTTSVKLGIKCRV